MCPDRHSFDYSGSGYLNLAIQTGARPRVGDTAEMVRARADFLAKGYLDPVAEAVAVSIGSSGVSTDCLVELGCGTGHYLSRAYARMQQAGDPPAGALGIDLSKAAISHAARAHPELRFVVADVQSRVPLVDGGASALLSVFAPRPAGECARVVAPGGVFVVAFATPGHLATLRRERGLLSVHPDKLETLSEQLAPFFSIGDQRVVEYELDLPGADVEHLVTMGPNAWHTPAPEVSGPSVAEISVMVVRFDRGG